MNKIIAFLVLVPLFVSATTTEELFTLFSNVYESRECTPEELEKFIEDNEIEINGGYDPSCTVDVDSSGAVISTFGFYSTRLKSTRERLEELEDRVKRLESREAD